MSLIQILHQVRVHDNFCLRLGDYHNQHSNIVNIYVYNEIVGNHPNAVKKDSNCGKERAASNLDN